MLTLRHCRFWDVSSKASLQGYGPYYNLGGKLGMCTNETYVETLGEGLVATELHRFNAKHWVLGSKFFNLHFGTRKAAKAFYQEHKADLDEGHIPGEVLRLV